MSTVSISIQVEHQFVSASPTPSALPLNNSAISSNQVKEQKVVPSCSSFLHQWFTKNVYPLVTPKRIFCFLLSQITFLLAYAAFTQTELYHSYINGCNHDHDHAIHQTGPMIFMLAAFIIHTLCLIFLMFFSFLYATFQKSSYYGLLKFHVVFFVQFLVTSLIKQIVKNHYSVQAAQEDDAAPAPAPAAPSSMNSNYSQLAVLAMTCFLTIDAFSVVILLQTSSQCNLLVATVTLTLPLGLAVAQNYLVVPAVVFIYVAAMLRNYPWRDSDQPQPPSIDELLPVV